MTVAQPARIKLVAVIVATTAALIARSWLQVELLADGLQKEYAADLSYLIVPPILLALLFPVLRDDKTFLLSQFRRGDISPRIIATAIAVGVLLRLISWSELVAGASFGFYRGTNPLAIEGPHFTFQCSSLHFVVLGFLVMMIMVPIIEELTHRAYIQSALHRHGPVMAVLVSAFVFAIFHPMASWPFTFFAGLVLGTQYWNTESLWPSLITHATVNGLIQIDWRCLKTQWNPPASELPIWNTGVPAALILLFSTCGIFWLIRKKKRRGEQPPRR